jgi:hypothetical protein
MKGWHRIADDIEHEPDWMAFALDALIVEIGRRLKAEARMDAHEDGV